MYSSLQTPRQSTHHRFLPLRLICTCPQHTGCLPRRVDGGARQALSASHLSGQVRELFGRVGIHVCDRGARVRIWSRRHSMMDETLHARMVQGHVCVFVSIARCMGRAMLLATPSSRLRNTFNSKARICPVRHAHIPTPHTHLARNAFLAVLFPCFILEFAFCTVRALLFPACNTYARMALERHSGEKSL